MATPITWQNINAPSLADASRPLEAAQRSFNGMFGQLGDMIAQREGLNEKNWQNSRLNNNNAYLDQVASYKTPEELAAAQASGALAQFKQGLGMNIDANVVRGADEQRMVALRNQTKQGFEYDNVLKDQRSHPFMDAYKVAAQKGDKVAMAAAEQSYNQAGGRDLAGLVTFADNTGWQKEQRGEERTDWARKAQDQVWQGEAHKDGLASSAVQRQTALGNLAANQAQVGIAKRGMSIREAEAMANQQMRLEDRLSKLREEYSGTLTGRAGSVKGQEAVMKAISSLEDPDNREQARLAFNRTLKENPSATTEAALQGVWGVSTKWWNSDSGQRQQFVDTVKASTTSGAGSADNDAAERRRTAIESSMNGLKAQLGKIPGAITVPVANTPVSTGQSLDQAANEYTAIRAAAGPAAVAAARASPPSQQPYSVERASFNQVQERRQAEARARTAADKAQFKAEERKQAARSLQVFENQIRALNRSDPSRNRDITLERAISGRDRLKKMLGE